MIRKVKSGWALFHCHGKSRGKRIKGSKHKTYKAALAQHKAIEVRRERRKTKLRLRAYKRR